MTIYELSNSIIFLNFKTSLAIPSPYHPKCHNEALRKKIDMWLTPYLIKLGYTRKDIEFLGFATNTKTMTTSLSKSKAAKILELLELIMAWDCN